MTVAMLGDPHRGNESKSDKSTAPFFNLQPHHIDFMAVAHCFFDGFSRPDRRAPKAQPADFDG